MEEKKTNVEDLNLLDLIKLIGEWIASFFRLCINCVGKTLQLLYRHRFLCLIMVAIGIGSGFYFSSKSKRVYNVDGMVKLHGLRAHTILKMGEQLSHDASNSDKRNLSEKLDLDLSIVKKINSIEFFPVIDYNKDSIPNVIDFKRKHPLEDTVNVVMNDYVFIRFQLAKNTNQAKEIGEAIIKFINNTPLIYTSFSSHKKNLLERLTLCDIELKRLDSLANKTYFEEVKKQIQFNNNQLFVGNKFIQLFYGDQLKLQNIKARIYWELSILKTPLEVPAGFIVDPNPINGRLKMLLKGILFAFIISILISYILENRKRWIEFLKKN